MLAPGTGCSFRYVLGTAVSAAGLGDVLCCAAGLGVPSVLCSSAWHRVCREYVLWALLLASITRSSSSPLHPQGARLGAKEQSGYLSGLLSPSMLINPAALTLLEMEDAKRRWDATKKVLCCYSCLQCLLNLLVQKQMNVKHWHTFGKHPSEYKQYFFIN